MNSPMLTPKQAAELLNVHPETLVRWRLLNQGPKFVKLGDKKNSPVRYCEDEIRRFLGR